MIEYEKIDRKAIIEAKQQKEPLNRRNVKKTIQF